MAAKYFRFVLMILLLSTTVAKKRILQKRSFSVLGCMGTYDKAKFARLNRICEECYNLYRIPSVQEDCRSNCFNNDMFPDCVSALLLGPEQQKFDSFVQYLYGKKK
ncbi:crustacean hyperglycemic hormone A-like [Limulus polyphemus]|uniref:Crustacean hyperglycemic hormone A-like n=1 Tax=Limulus polyphemus TaxID=6850 RepID=A0ABM1SA93_LIMPO|nr:crustacean hyperglycemic hormone A-like [Limulus polyphemus]